MSYYKNIKETENKIKDLKLNKVFEKHIPKSVLEIFHSVVDEFLKNKKFILKGGRALNHTMKIYEDHEINYVDYDLYAIDPKNELIEISRLLLSKGISETSVENIIFKPHIYRLYIYSIPMIDVEPVSEELWNTLPTFEKMNHKIIDINFQKLDMYVQVARPTLLNVSNWKKVIHRLVALNKVKNFEKTDILEKGENKSYLSDYLGLIDKDAIITGQIAYYLYMNEKKKDNDLFIPNINRIEIFTHKIDKYIDIFKKALDGDIRIEEKGGFMELLSRYYIIYQNDEPLIFIYYLDDCISYYEEQNLRFSSYHHLMFYLQLFYYLPISKEYNYQNKIQNMIYYLDKFPQKIELNCFGYRNPGVLALRKVFIKKDLLFKFRPITLSPKPITPPSSSKNIIT